MTPKQGLAIYEKEKARSEMWASLIPGYQEADRNKKKKLKQEYRRMSGFNEETAGLMAKTLSSQSCFAIFDDCIAQESDKPSLIEKREARRKGNDNMYVEQNMTVKEKTTEDVRREHFLDELSRLYSSKNAELREKFGLSLHKSPRSPKELVEWIKAGDWSYIKSYDPESDDPDEGGWCPYEPVTHGIRWTKVKEDRKGYDAARKVLDSELHKFKNEIWAEVDPASFIKILASFEKAKIH